MPPVDFTLQEISIAPVRQDAELRSLTVGYAPQVVQRTVESDASIPPVWKEALQDALNRSLVFTDDASTRVNLSVRITEFDIPAEGFTMTTRVSAIYEVIDRSDGALLFSEEISSEGIVPLDYAFMGGVRMVESWNRAVRVNIADFLDRLGSSRLVGDMQPPK